MKLKDLGYTNKIEKLRIENDLENFEIGRVTSEHKERYRVKTEQGEFDAEITGNLRYTANGREDFPAVGDWVALIIYDEHTAIIHKVLPRYSILSRKAIGQSSDIQIIATNIDCAFIVQAVDRDFSINRMERYLSICNSTNIQPVMLLNKIDLIEETLLSQMTESIQHRIKNVPLFAISNHTEQGLEQLKEFILKDKTYCLLGSSGVGKSSLLNTLMGEEKMKTNAISGHSNRGQHATTHRELIVLRDGGILIDNPGMREIGITDSIGDLEKTFKSLLELSKYCKFNDCTHTTEVNCAVITAIENGKLDRASYENYLKMKKERAHYETSTFEKKKREKQFGKMVKHYQKRKNRNR